MSRTACTLLALALGCGRGKEAAPEEAKRAYEAYAAALRAGDLEKAIPYRAGAVRTPNAPSSSQQTALALGLLQMNVPKDARVTGASVEGDDAALIVKGTGLDGKPMEVWVTMARTSGAWKIVKETLNLQAK